MLFSHRLRAAGCDEGTSKIVNQLLAASDTLGSTWHVYTQPIDLEAGDRLVTLAHRLGYKPSGEVIVEGRSTLE